MSKDVKERSKEELKDEVNKMMSKSESENIGLEYLDAEEYESDKDRTPKRKKSKKHNKKKRTSRKGSKVKKAIKMVIPYVGSFIAGAGVATGFMVAIGGKHDETDIPGIDKNDDIIDVNDFSVGSEDNVTEF